MKSLLLGFADSSAILSYGYSEIVAARNIAKTAEWCSCQVWHATGSVALTARTR